ncbi:MAG: DUF378 domain-containing protein [Rhabdochlamydiaceae bacterium]|jgi:uncharacterized membrane protein YuzA (DUF378 family)
MKKIDFIVALILILGGLNWGLVGMFDINMTDYISIKSSIIRIIYSVVGFCAVYQLLRWKQVYKR